MTTDELIEKLKTFPKGTALREPHGNYSAPISVFVVKVTHFGHEYASITMTRPGETPEEREKWNNWKKDEKTPSGS